MAGSALFHGGLRSRRLLTALLLNSNNAVPKERLIDILWEEPPESAHQQIHNVIAGLRQHLKPAAGLEIVTCPGGYRLVLDDFAIDLRRFRRAVAQAHAAHAAGRVESAIALLTEACGLWRGPALDGLTPPYFQSAAARLEEERLAAVELLCRLRIRAGQARSAVVELTELVVQHPLRESLCVSLMEALYVSGRTADALAAYDTGRRRLAEELGLDPGAELKAMHEVILQGISLTVKNPPVEKTTAFHYPRAASTCRFASTHLRGRRPHCAR